MLLLGETAGTTPSDDAQWEAARAPKVWGRLFSCDLGPCKLIVLKVKLANNMGIPMLFFSTLGVSGYHARTF